MACGIQYIQVTQIIDILFFSTRDAREMRNKKLRNSSLIRGINT